MTLTEQLVGRMASVKKEMAATMKYMKSQTGEIDALHDEAAEAIAAIDGKLAKDPTNEDLLRRRAEYDKVREGLYAASEYGTGLMQQVASGQ